MDSEIRARSAMPMRIVVLLLLAGAAWLALAFTQAGGTPEVKIEPATAALGRRTPVTVKVREPRRGITTVRVEAIQGEHLKVLGEVSEQPRPFWAFWQGRPAERELSFEVGRETMPELVGGEAKIRVTAGRAATPLRHPGPVVSELTLPVRLTPPSLAVISTQNNVQQGGSEVVVYRVGATAVRDGVEAGEWFFPGYPLPGGGEGERFALYAVPYDLDDPTRVRLVAEDEVGNQAATRFLDRFTPRQPTAATIELSDTFLTKAVPEILGHSPEIQDQGDLLKSYLLINGELRRRNNLALRQLAASSRPEFLWHQPFRQLGNSQVMASFADHRSYVYGGQVVDHQYHLGFDLASVKKAPVTAANRGVVAMAGYFGIYGNTVVLDHGYGLATLYAHLSAIDVAVGQTVEAGQKVGTSGETGLAAGDHLHFSVLLQGLCVTPVEWWDGKWIRDHLVAKLGAALPLGG